MKTEKGEGEREEIKKKASKEEEWKTAVGKGRRTKMKRQRKNG